VNIDAVVALAMAVERAEVRPQSARCSGGYDYRVPLRRYGT
jgi:hypothetical protein